ncbi:MAG: TlpA family protein disulfide reductase [Blastocatellia bacterium]|nr:TlpA family protein disulfide reductase [Blastocatellia bacterium]
MKYIYLILIVGLCLGNVLLLKQNLDLRGELQKYQPKRLQIGDKLQSFRVEGLTEDSVEVNFSNSGYKKVFLFFTPECPYCQQQLPYWKTLLEKADKNRFEIIGLLPESEDREKAKGYVKSLEYGNLRVALAPPELLKSYQLSATPTTVIASSDGTVEELFAGSWGEQEVAKVEKIFGVELTKK